MTDWQREISSWLRGLKLSPNREAEIVEELSQHVEDRYQDLLNDGLSEEEASHAALAEIQQSDLLVHELEQVERPVSQEPVVLGATPGKGFALSIWQDLRYALRMLVRERGITAVAVITMALGIGVNTTIFSTLELLVFRPFDFGNQDRLVTIWEQQLDVGIRRSPAAPGNFNDWREQSQTFEHLVAISSGYFDLHQGDQPERFSGNRVSVGFFEALGAKPAVGRTFAADETLAGNDSVVVIKHSLWQDRFGADPQIAGRVINLNGKSFTVVGVMPKGFDFPVGSGELWVPLVFSPPEHNERERRYLQVIGLPRSDVTLEQARADLGAIAQRAEQEFPQTNRGRSVRVVSLVEDATRGARVGAPFMFIAVLLVLLIACANVANLLLVRAASQQREIAIRLALGASRFRVMRQLLADSLLLAGLGGALGLLLSVWMIDLVRDIPHDFSRFIPGWEHIAIDRAALAFTLVMSVVTGSLCGLIPALTGTKVNLNEALKEGDRGSVGARSHRPRRLLVISEVALSFVLLAGAGVMLRSFVQLMRADFGIDATNVLTMQVALSEERYAAEPARTHFCQTLIERLAAVPGVVSAGAVGTLPLSYTYHNRECLSIGQTIFPQNQRPAITWRVASPGYFAAIGTPLREGRGFTEHERARVALVNQAFVKQFLPNQRVLGQHFRADDKEPYEIVGVVANVINEDMEERAEAEIYVPYALEPWRTFYLVIRSSSNPLGLTDTVRREVKTLDSTAPTFNVKSMEQLVDERLSPKRLAVYALGGSALIALLLAAVGIYSVIAYSVTQQTHDIGVRLALGAQPRHVLKLVVGGGMKLVLLGVAIGLMGAWLLTRLLTGLLFGVSAQDPATLAGITVLLAGVALLACYIPARRATKVDPIIALRCE